MSEKQWHGGGIYSKVLKRSLAGKRVRVFYGRVFVPQEGRQVYFRLGTTLKAAQREMNRVLGNPAAALAEREAPTPRRIRFDALVEEFLAKYRSRGDSDYYQNISRSWIKYFGRVDAGSITFAQVEDYRDSLKRQEYSDSTIRKYVGGLGTMYRWGIKRGLMTDDPILRWSRTGEGVKRPQEPDRQVEVLTRDEEANALDAADRQTSIAIDLYIASGMRLGEGLDLRWPQVDRHGGAILINKSKTGKARSIPLNARLTGILARATKHIRSDFVLCDRDGEPLDRYVITRAVESTLQRAGIQKKPGAVFNLLRHTFGSRMAEAGVDMTTLATIMGNSPDICYKHYIRFSPGHLKAVMAKVDRPSSVAQDGARASNGVGSGSVSSLQVVDQ